jgi:hypothetical protein
MKLNESWLMLNGNYKCPFCDKEFVKKGIMSHIIFSHTVDGRKNMIERVKNVNHSKMKGRPTWIKGLNKEIDIRVKNMSENISKKMIGMLGHPHNEKTKQLLSELAIKNELGGHTSKKQIYYKTKNGDVIFLQSSYEIKVATDLDDNNIKWIRPKFFLWIDEHNVTHRYYPDFYLIDYDVYLDPKNFYLQKKDKLKIDTVQKQNKIKIIILSENELVWNVIKEKMPL